MGQIAEAIARGLELVEGRICYGDYFSYDFEDRLCACWWGALALGLNPGLVPGSEQFYVEKIQELYEDHLPGLGDILSSEGIFPDVMNDNEEDWDVITAQVEEAYDNAD